MRVSTIAVGVTALLASWAEARTPHIVRQTESEYINAADPDNSPVTLSINLRNTAARNKTAPYLYGLMFEDINHSGDGGIYGELLTNRAFQGSNVQTGSVDGLSGSVIVSSENPIVPYGPVLTGWDTVGNSNLSLDILHPLSQALPTVMQLDIPANTTGEVGFKNYGWWGMSVTPQTYTGSFYALANAPRHQSNFGLTVSLRSNITGETFCSTRLSNVSFPLLNYKQYNFTIPCNVTAPSSNNTFFVTMDGAEVSDSTFYFGLISLFPETFKNRPNGLRKDLAETFYDMKPTFLRFPGGNNLEGVSVFKRWNWRNTIGPLKDRPGRPGDWNYINTDGLGLLEFLEWTEDMDIERVLAVYAGFSLDIWGQEGTSFPEEDMAFVLQEALDEIEYCQGDTSTTYGALRASHGHPEPFPIHSIEIGNEDWFSDSYPYRFKYMYNGLKAKYPNINYISTAYNEAATSYNYTINIPSGVSWDTHHYEEPSFFVRGFDFYDNWQQRTNNTGVDIFLGEYSVYQVDTTSGMVNYSNPVGIHIPYPQLVSAIGEGIYLLGLERNPNVCKMVSYAPSLMNRNWYNWTPDMISFTADPNQTVPSSSYWQQWLWAHYQGTESVPVTATKGKINPLFWGAQINGESSVYLKVVNAGNSSVPLTVDIDRAWRSVNGTILTASDLHSYNTNEDKHAVAPKALQFGHMAHGGYGGRRSFQWTVPRFSLTVLQFDL